MKLMILSKWRVVRIFFILVIVIFFIPQHNSLKYFFPDA